RSRPGEPEAVRDRVETQRHTQETVVIGLWRDDPSSVTRFRKEAGSDQYHDRQTGQRPVSRDAAEYGRRTTPPLRGSNRLSASPLIQLRPVTYMPVCDLRALIANSYVIK